MNVMYHRNHFVRFAGTELPFYFVQDVRNTFKGHIGHLLASYTLKFNLSYVVNLHGTAHFGDVLEDGTDGTGLVGSLIRNESDLSIIPMEPDEKTIKFLKFSGTIYKQDIPIVSITENPIKSITFSLFSIYGQEVWYLLIIFITLLSILSTNYTRLIQTKNIRKEISYFKSLETQIFLFIASILRQAISIGSSYIYLLIWATWLISGFWLSSGFSGVILSKLTFPIIPDSINNLQDLLLKKNISIYVMKDTPIEARVKISADKTVMKIWEKVVLENSCKDVEEIVEILMNLLGLSAEQSASVNLATLLPASYLKEGFQEIGICDDVNLKRKLHVSNEKPPFTIQLSLPYNKYYKNSDVIRSFLFMSSRFFECGIINFLIETKVSRAESCFSMDLSLNKDTTVKPVSFANLQTTFRIVLPIMVLGVLVFIVEILAPVKDIKFMTSCPRSKSIPRRRRRGRDLRKQERENATRTYKLHESV